MISCTWKSSSSVYCAILSLSLHLSLILSSVECSKSAAAAVNHLNRAIFTSWSSYGEKGGGCFYKQYHDVNQTESHICNVCSLATCHEHDHVEFRNVKISTSKDNETANDSSLNDGDFEIKKVEIEQARLEDETNGIKRHLFIAFHIQCQNASTIQTFISINNVKHKTTNGVPDFCHQITHSCSPSDQVETYAAFSEVLGPDDFYMLDLLFYSDSEAVIRNEDKSYVTTNRALVKHTTISLAPPPINAPVEGPMLGSSNNECEQLMMSSRKGYTQWQIYAVVLTVFSFLAFLAALVVIALRTNHFNKPQPHRPTVRLKKCEDNDCSVLIETDEDNTDWGEDEVFMATRNRSSSLTRTSFHQ